MVRVTSIGTGPKSKKRFMANLFQLKGKKSLIDYLRNLIYTIIIVWFGLKSFF